MATRNWFTLFTMISSDTSAPPPPPRRYRVSPKKATFEIQISALIQTTYCIQFQRMQFHMIRSFSPMCIKLRVFTHSSFKSNDEFQRTTIGCLN